MTLRLAIFDVDGTLVDSQADILTSMATAFAAVGLDAPERAAILSIVGLSLPQAMARLAPDLDDGARMQMVEAYKAHYLHLRQAGQTQSVLYPGAVAALKALHAVPDVLLAVATGKSRRGLDAVLAGHGLTQLFVSTQVSDDHPSKPHPSMILTALAETGVDARDAVMIGDTTYDMEMAVAAGVAFVGVDWGYHPAGSMRHALTVLSAFEALPGRLFQHWEIAA